MSTGGGWPWYTRAGLQNYTPTARFKIHPTPQKTKLHPPFPKLWKNPFWAILDQGQCQQQAKTRKSHYIPKKFRLRRADRIVLDTTTYFLRLETYKDPFWRGSCGLMGWARVNVKTVLSSLVKGLSGSLSPKTGSDNSLWVKMTISQKDQNFPCQNRPKGTILGS